MLFGTAGPKGEAVAREQADGIFTVIPVSSGFEWLHCHVKLSDFIRCSMSGCKPSHSHAIDFRLTSFATQFGSTRASL